MAALKKELSSAINFYLAAPAVGYFLLKMNKQLNSGATFEKFLKKSEFYNPFWTLFLVYTIIKLLNLFLF